MIGLMMVSVETAAQILGISRAGYAAVRTGQIPSIKIGKRVLVSRAWIEKVLAV
jgi:excisionase family DNA binding protein